MHWTKTKPTEPGAYWVRGYCIGRTREKALVEVRSISGELCSNLHAVNSDNDTDDFDPLARHNDSFEWCGPLVPSSDVAELIVANADLIEMCDELVAVNNRTLGRGAVRIQAAIINRFLRKLEANRCALARVTGKQEVE